MNIPHSLAPTIPDKSPVGPLHTHIGGFAETLVKQGYSSYAIDQKIRLLADLDRWLIQRRLKIQDLAEEHIEKFLRCRRNRGHGRGGDPSTLRSLLGILRENRIISSPVVKPDANAFDDIQKHFSQYLIDERGLNPATVAWYVFETRTFLSACFGKGSVSLGQLSSRHIAQHVLHRARSTSPRGAQRTVTALRSFLRFLQQRGDIATNLAGSVPKVANWSAGGLPKYLPAAEVELLLDSCDGQTAEGRRSRAILLLLARLGLRAGDVVRLRFSDVDWKEGVIRVSGKGRRETVLPLSQEVGDALAAYIKDHRPQADTDGCGNIHSLRSAFMFVPKSFHSPKRPTSGSCGGLECRLRRSTRSKTGGAQTQLYRIAFAATFSGHSNAPWGSLPDRDRQDFEASATEHNRNLRKG